MFGADVDDGQRIVDWHAARHAFTDFTLSKDNDLPFWLVPPLFAGTAVPLGLLSYSGPPRLLLCAMCRQSVSPQQRHRVCGLARIALVRFQPLSLFRITSVKNYYCRN